MIFYMYKCVHLGLQYVVLPVDFPYSRLSTHKEVESDDIEIMRRQDQDAWQRRRRIHPQPPQE
jgi:hypothetical protein